MPDASGLTRDAGSGSRSGRGVEPSTPKPFTATAPLLSVIIPTYNRAALLPNAVSSAALQTQDPAQIVVVDDGSTDETPSVLARLQGVEWVSQANRGPSAARNGGMERARGGFIAFLDSDDAWDPEFLSTLVSLLRENQDVGFAFANWRGADASGAVTYPDYMAAHPYYHHAGSACGQAWRTLDSRQARALFLEHSAAPSSAVVVRRDCAVAWDETVRIGEDNLFLLEVLLKHRCGCAFMTKPLWTKRGSPANLCDGNQDASALARQHLAMAGALLKRHRSALDWSEVCTVRRGMAADWRDWAYWEARAGHRRGALGLYGRSFVALPSWRSLRGAAGLLLPRRS